MATSQVASDLVSEGQHGLSALSAKMMLVNLEQDKSSEAGDAISAPQCESVHLQPVHFERSELLRAVLDASPDATLETTLSLSLWAWQMWKEHAVRPRFEALSDAASITLMQTAAYLQDDAMVTAIAAHFARRINRPIAERARCHQQLYFRACIERFAQSADGAASLADSRVSSHAEATCSDAGALSSASPSCGGAAVAASGDLELHIETLLATLPPHLVARVLRAVPQPLAPLLCALPPAAHGLAIESRVSPARALDLSYQLLAASADVEDGGGGDTPLATACGAPSTPGSPDSLTILALNPLSLDPPAPPAPAPSPSALPAARPWELTAAAAAAPALFKRAKFDVRPATTVPAAVEVVAPLLPPLGALPLRALSLSHNALSDAAAGHLAPALAALPALTSLDISDNDLTERGLYALGRAAPQLRALRAGFNKLYDRDSLGPALARNGALERLSLAGNILSGSCGMLRGFLRALTALEELDLAETGLVLDDVRALAPALAAMPALASLKLARNRVAGCKGDLGEVVACFAGLRRLDLSGMCMGQKLAEDARGALGACTALEALDLRGNGIDAEAYAASLPPALAAVALLA